MKKLIDNRVVQEGASSLYSSQNQANNSTSNKVLKLSQWTYTQLRVLIISGGNRAFQDYMDTYDLMSEAVQKRYNTLAAQYYRDLLKNKINGGNHVGMLVQQPDYEQGRKRSNQLLKTTKQIVPYSKLDNVKILKELMSKKRIEDKPVTPDHKSIRVDEELKYRRAANLND